MAQDFTQRNPVSADKIKVSSTKTLTGGREIEMIESGIAAAKRTRMTHHA
jgi:hypothetical protein